MSVHYGIVHCDSRDNCPNGVRVTRTHSDMAAFGRNTEQYALVPGGLHVRTPAGNACDHVQEPRPGMEMVNNNLLTTLFLVLCVLAELWPAGL